VQARAEMCWQMVDIGWQGPQRLARVCKGWLCLERFGKGWQWFAMVNYGWQKSARIWQWLVGWARSRVGNG